MSHQSFYTYFFNQYFLSDQSAFTEAKFSAFFFFEAVDVLLIHIVSLLTAVSRKKREEGEGREGEGNERARGGIAFGEREKRERPRNHQRNLRFPLTFFPSPSHSPHSLTLS